MSEFDDLKSKIELIKKKYKKDKTQIKNNSIALKQSIELRFANKDLYEQAEASRLEALQANADKSKFLAAASHDLRQPVRVVKYPRRRNCSFPVSVDIALTHQPS